MNITFTNLTPLSRKILDELSDGQWHPITKITKNIERGSLKSQEFKNVLSEELTNLVNSDLLLSGNNNSYRFQSEQLFPWREISGNPRIEDKQYQPRRFGGLLEDDGWAKAPLKDYDLVHFKADGSLSRQTVHATVGGKISLIQIENGLYRIFNKNGEEVLENLKELKENQPHYEIRSMRLEKELKRRDLEDLPAGYLSDLCKYYGKFAKILLRPYASVIAKHIPDHDDVQQQIYLWVLDAVQRYDDSTSIPFAAYLGTSLTKWVHNLNRNAFGRSVADAELKHSRAITTFKLEHGREPRVEELAKILDVEVSAVKKESLVINTVVNLRNVATIHTEETDIPIPSTEMVDDNLNQLVTNTLLSASIVTAVREDMAKRNTQKDLTGLLAVYYETWGAVAASKKTKMWLRTSKTQTTMKRVLLLAKERMRKN